VWLDGRATLTSMRTPPYPRFHDPSVLGPRESGKLSRRPFSTNHDSRFLRFFWLISGGNFGSQSSVEVPPDPTARLGATAVIESTAYVTPIRARSGHAEGLGERIESTDCISWVKGVALHGPSCRPQWKSSRPILDVEAARARATISYGEMGPSGWELPPGGLGSQFWICWLTRR
jgi:hypothetical protein